MKYNFSIQIGSSNKKAEYYRIVGMPVFVIQFTSLLYSLSPRQRLLATASNSIANDVGSKVRCCSNSDQVRCAELKKNGGGSVR